MKRKIHNHKDKPLYIYGRHAVIAAIKNPRRKCKTLYTTAMIKDELKSQFNNINIQIRDPRDFAIILGIEANHQNMVLEVEPLQRLAIEDIINTASTQEHSCMVILDQVSDPHNIGAIIRSAAAFSVDAVILPENNSPKENNTINKTSAGATEVVPLISVTNIARTIKDLKNEGYWIIGLDGDTSTELDSKIFANKVVFILGSEDTGMRKLTKENCDYIAKINISDNTKSLNVSNAAAIAMYEFQKYSKA